MSYAQKLVTEVFRRRFGGAVRGKLKFVIFSDIQMILAILVEV